MKASVIVWDLETVPDLGGFAPPTSPRAKFVAEILAYQRRPPGSAGVAVEV
jgi:hypothetical protein